MWLLERHVLELKFIRRAVNLCHASEQLLARCCLVMFYRSGAMSLALSQQLVIFYPSSCLSAVDLLWHPHRYHYHYPHCCSRHQAVDLQVDVACFSALQPGCSTYHVSSGFTSHLWLLAIQ